MHEDSLFWMGKYSVLCQVTGWQKTWGWNEWQNSLKILLLGRKFQAWVLAGVEPKNFSTEGSLRAATATNQLTIAYLSFFSLPHSLVLSQFPTSSLRFFFFSWLYTLFQFLFLVCNSSFPYLFSTSPYCFFLSILLISFPNSLPFRLSFIPYSSHFYNSYS